MKAKPYFRFSGPVKYDREAVWESSTITVKNTGGWFIFRDKDKKLLNKPQPIVKAKKSYYRHIPYRYEQPQVEYNEFAPTNTEVSQNYSYFVPKRELISTYQEPLRTRVDDEEHYPRVQRRGFTGKEPLTAPIRMSTKVLNEKRTQEVEQIRFKPPQTSHNRSPRRLHRMNDENIKPSTAPY